MTEYRVFMLDYDAHFSGPARIIHCADDAEAVEKTRQLMDGKDLELWDGGRLVARFPHN
jgi:hypothetical protein